MLRWKQGFVSESQAAEGGVPVAWVLFQARKETGRAREQLWLVGPLIGMCAYTALSQKRVASGGGEEGGREPTSASPAIRWRQLHRLQGYSRGFYFQFQSLPKWVCGSSPSLSPSVLDLVCKISLCRSQCAQTSLGSEHQVTWSMTSVF